MRKPITVVVVVGLMLVFGSLVSIAQASEQLEAERVPNISGGAQSVIDPVDVSQIQDLLEGTPADLLAAGTNPLQSMTRIDKAFEGFDFDDNGSENDGFRFIPPDPIGAAGLSRVIAVTNTMIEGLNKGGSVMFRSGLADFFAPLSPTTFTFDPKVVYDEHEDRYVVATLERVASGNAVDPGNISRVLLAVSKDGNPKTATARDWFYQAIDSKLLYVGFVELWADYPGFEVDEEAIYVTANMFAFPPYSGYAGVQLLIVDKGLGSDGLYDGGASAVGQYDPYASGGIATTTMPTQIHGEGGVLPGSEIGTFLVSYSGLTYGGPGAPEALQVVTVVDPLGRSGGPYFLPEFVDIGDIEDVGGVFGFPALPDAPQLGTDALIEVNDRRALDAVWRDDSLWVTTTIIPNAGADAGETTAHWFKIDAGAGPGALILDDQGDIGGEDIAAGTFTFFPAVAVNRNNQAMFGFSGSAPSIFAGAFAAGRNPADPSGSVRESMVVREGVDSYFRTFGGSRNRWGDYSGISTDPSNDKFFWIFNQYAAERGTIFS
ncbi:MAG: hypothetical protein P8127_08710, partial [Acidobacteriota bacterium]